MLYIVGQQAVTAVSHSRSHITLCERIRLCSKPNATLQTHTVSRRCGFMPSIPAGWKRCHQVLTTPAMNLVGVLPHAHSWPLSLKRQNQFRFNNLTAAGRQKSLLSPWCSVFIAVVAPLQSLRYVLRHCTVLQALLRAYCSNLSPRTMATFQTKCCNLSWCITSLFKAKCSLLFHSLSLSLTLLMGSYVVR